MMIRIIGETRRLSLNSRMAKLENIQGNDRTLCVHIRDGQSQEEVDKIIDDAPRANNATREDYDNIIQIVKFAGVMPGRFTGGL